MIRKLWREWLCFRAHGNLRDARESLSKVIVSAEDQGLLQADEIALLRTAVEIASESKLWIVRGAVKQWR